MLKLGGNFLIIKPIDSLQGQGIFKVDLDETFDVKTCFARFKGQNVLIEEGIRQHPSMYFENSSVNTIRVFTVLDREGKGHIIKAVLRAGRGNSVVDNFCAGGAFYPVDVNEGIVVERGMDVSGARVIYHPGSSVCMVGFHVPNWSILIQKSLEAAQSFPQCRFVGWDIAVTNSGVEFIEGNQYPDYEFLEFIGTTGHYKNIMAYY